MKRWTVGVDFGGTNIKIGLVNAAHHVVRSQVLSSKIFGPPAQFVEGIGCAVESLTQAVGVRPAQLRGVGLGVPGAVDVERGVVHSVVNVPGWHEVPLRGRLERRLRCRCVIDNDANLYTLGEWAFGAGRGARQLVGLTLGTGVGGGLIFDGALYRGSHGAAGEIGHMVIEPKGRRCGCGARGCLEAQVGTAAILSLARAAICHGAEPLRTLARQASGNLTPEVVDQAARQGDAAAQHIWNEVGHSLGIGLANVTNLLNPDRIVLGGGIANAWGLFSPELLHTLRTQAMEVSARAVRVVRARLGNSAGIVGAAVLVWNEVKGKGRGARGVG